MIKKISFIIGFFVVGMVGGIFANQIFWPYFVERPLFYQYGLEQRPIHLTEKKEIYIQENVALLQAVEKVEQAVVSVRTTTKTGKKIEGSGLVITADGLIVTLAELVPQGADFSFFVNNEKKPYQVLKRDLEENLALIKLSASNLTTASFVRPNDLKPGEKIFLVGGIFENGTIFNSVNEGIVKYFDKKLIQTTIIEKGPLGGSPVFNVKGEIVGISLISNLGNLEVIPISIIREFVGI